MKSVLLATLLLVPLLATAQAEEEARGIAAVRYPPKLVEIVGALGARAEADAADRANFSTLVDLPAILEEGRKMGATDPVRARSAINNFETYLANARASDVWAVAKLESSPETRRRMILDAADEERRLATAEIVAFRADLKAYEEEITSVAALDWAIYAASQAVVAQGNLANFGAVRNAFLSETNPGEAGAHEMVAPNAIARERIAVARELLAEARLHDGEGYAINRTAFVVHTDDIWETSRESQPVGGHLAAIESVLTAARRGGERIYALAAYYELLQSDRGYAIAAMFADAESRGKDAGADLRDAMQRPLAEANVTYLRAKGFEGLWGIDRIDAALYTLSVPNSTRFLPYAWAGVQVTETFTAYVSALSTAPDPVVAAKPTPTETPALPAVAVLVSAGAVALLAGARRRARR